MEYTVLGLIFTIFVITGILIVFKSIWKKNNNKQINLKLLYNVHLNQTYICTVLNLTPIVRVCVYLYIKKISIGCLWWLSVVRTSNLPRFPCCLPHGAPESFISCRHLFIFILLAVFLFISSETFLCGCYFCEVHAAIFFLSVWPLQMDELIM